MRVEILHIDECPNWIEAGARLRQALDVVGLPAVDIGFRLLASSDEAAQVPFAGSPTIVIDGSDPFPGDATTDLACRVYWTETGADGVPTVEQLVEALRERLGPQRAEEEPQVPLVKMRHKGGDTVCVGGQ